MIQLKPDKFYPLWCDVTNEFYPSFVTTHLLYIKNDTTEFNILKGNLYDLKRKQLGSEKIYIIRKRTPFLIHIEEFGNWSKRVIEVEPGYLFQQAYFAHKTKLSTEVHTLQKRILNNIRYLNTLPEGDDIYYEHNSFTHTAHAYRKVRVLKSGLVLFNRELAGTRMFTQHAASKLIRTKSNLISNEKKYFLKSWKHIIKSHRQCLLQWSNDVEAYHELEKQCAAINRKYQFRLIWMMFYLGLLMLSLAITIIVFLTSFFQ